MLTLCFLLSVTVVSGFGLKGLAPTAARTKSDVQMKLTSINDSASASKLRSLKGIATTLLGTLTVATAKSTRAFAIDKKEEKYIDTLSVLLQVKKIIEPTKQFVFLQAYDNARTNIRYTLNQLQLQKNVDFLIQNSIDFTEDMDSIDAAQDVGSKLTNTLLQFDNTVYTCIFIPSDDGTVPPSAEKYRKQTYDFYNVINDSVDTMLKVATEKQLAAAVVKANAAVKALPPVLFKEVKSFAPKSDNGS